MLMNLKSLFLNLSIFILFLVSSIHAQNPKEIWSGALKKCGYAAGVQSEAVFLGFGSGEKIGDILAVYPDGKIGPGSPLETYGGNNKNTLIQPGQSFNCAVQRDSKFSIKPSIGLTLQVLPIGGELNASIKRAKKINIEAKEVQAPKIYDINYQTYY